MTEITLGQVQNVLLFIIAFGGAVWTIVKAVKSIIEKALKPLTNKIDNLEDKIGELKENDKKNGDMIYQMLDHLATNNNSGGMKKALDDYNTYYRHG